MSKKVTVWSHLHVVGIFSLLMLLPITQYAYAAPPSVAVSGTFLRCCYGFLQIQGSVTDAKGSVDQVRVQVYAPNNQLISDHKVKFDSVSGHFTDGLGISRDQGKGNYIIIVTYRNHFSGQTEVPSWINNDPVVSVTASEFADGSASIQGRVLNSIAGEEISIAIHDPTGSTTSSYTQGVAIQGQFSRFIYTTQAECEADTGDPSMCPGPFSSEAFPTSGDYTIVATHLLTGMTASTTLAYTR